MDAKDAPRRAQDAQPADLQRAAVQRALLHERAATRAWLHDRPLQMLELIAAGGYADRDPAWLRHLAAKAADELRAYVERDLDEPWDGDLVAALREVVADAELLSPAVVYELLIGPMQTSVAPSQVSALAAAAGEALTNVRKHAHAGRVVVSCEATPAAVKVTVQDDGVGAAAEGATAGFGVRRSLRDRMQRCGGSAEIDSRPGGGTRVTLRIAAAPAAGRLRAQG